MTKGHNALLKVTLLGMVVGLTGCNPFNNNSASAQQVSPTVEPTSGSKAKAAVTSNDFVSHLPVTAPIYKVITTGTMAPFSFSNDKGILQGFDIDAMREIGEAGGFRVEFYKLPFKDMFADVENGKYDLAASGISFTNERNGKYNLSDSYFFNPSAVMYKGEGLQIHGLADLTGKKVGGMHGTKQLEQVKTVAGVASVDGFDSTYLLFQGLIQGKEDVIVQDEPLLRYTAKNFPAQKVTIVAYEGQNEPSAQQIVLMRKGNDELTAKVNKGIATIKANGKLKAIEEKWFGK